MWYYGVIIIFISFKSTFGLNMNEIEFCIDYLRYREVNLACLLSCGDDFSCFWNCYFNGTGTGGTRDLNFTRNTSFNSIAVSKVKIDGSNNKTEKYYSINSCLKQDFISIAIILNARCQNSEDLLYFASENKYFDSMRKWIIIDNGYEVIDNSNYINDSNYNDNIVHILDRLNISVDADIILASEKENSKYTLFDLFNFGKIQGGSLVINEVGSWDLVTGLRLFVDLNGYKYYRRWNFQELSIRMVLVVSPAPEDFDLKMLAELKPVAGVATITHSSVTVLSVVAEIHNFRYIHTITDRWVATFDRNSTKAVSNMLYFGEQDISPVIRFLSSINEELDIVNTPITSIETKYYYRIPTYGPGKFENQFLRPLSKGAWWCVIAVSVLCAVLLLLSACHENRPSSVQYAIFSVIASICQQFFQDIDDSGTRRESTARKLTLFVTGISCVLIFNYYTSSVVSWLLNGPPPSINSLQELLESPLELIYQDVGYTKSWLQTPTYYYNKANAKIEDEIRQKKVFNKKKNALLLVPLEKGIKMVKDGGYAYHTEKSIANDLISRSFSQSELCELGSLQSIPKADLYPCVQKNSPYKEFMTWSLMHLSERGIVSRIQRRTSSPEISCEGSSPRALALGGAAPAFILLAAGYMLAVFIMIIERYTYKTPKTNFTRSSK